MIGIVGTKLFGRVDDLDEDRYVATNFHHIFGVPLAYQGTFLITGAGDEGFHGIRLPISWKSIGFAYLRTGLFLVVVIAGLAAVDAVFERSPASAGVAAVGLAVAWLGFTVSYRWGKPSGARRQELLRRLARPESGGRQGGGG